MALTVAVVSAGVAVSNVVNVTCPCRSYLHFLGVDCDVYLHSSLFKLVPVQRNSSLVNLDKSKTIVIESGFFDANRIPTLKSTPKK